MLQQIQDGRTDKVIDWVEAGHSPSSTDSQGVYLLQWCAYYGDVSAIKYLLNKGADLLALGENLDLQAAAFHGHWQLCQFLLENGADPNFASPSTGETSLHAALSKALRPAYNLVIELLLTYGADPNKASLPDRETGSFMRDVRTRAESPLHRAAAFADASTIQLLIDAGADKTQQDMHGDSPLSWASWHLRPGKILALLAYGNHRIHPLHEEHITSDHGAGWGNGMERNLLGKPLIE